jgi:prepilin-type N-terminal cleavage/methylation domain-containing protein
MKLRITNCKSRVAADVSRLNYPGKWSGLTSAATILKTDAPVGDVSDSGGASVLASRLGRDKAKRSRLVSSVAPPKLFRAFTLIEIMVVVTLLSLIVLALMTVFNSTQAAFRASATQADVLQGGRAVMDLMVQDLKGMSPSFGQSNNPANTFLGVVNFYAAVNNGFQPLVQPLIASSPPQSRTNVLESFFILSSGNQNGVPTWYGTGYTVTPNALNGSLYSLYRFSTNLPVAIPNSAIMIFNDFQTNFLSSPTNGSHLIDGVIGLRVRAYDTNGVWMTNGYAFGQPVTVKNILFLPGYGEVGFYMYSNSLPASVEIEMAVLEDRTLQRAESFGLFSGATNYLVGQSGKVHVFRQRVSIPNVDPSAYQ